MFFDHTVVGTSCNACTSGKSMVKTKDTNDAEEIKDILWNHQTVWNQVVELLGFDNEPREGSIREVINAAIKLVAQSDKPFYFGGIKPARWIDAIPKTGDRHTRMAYLLLEQIGQAGFIQPALLTGRTTELTVTVGEKMGMLVAAAISKLFKEIEASKKNRIEG